MKKDRWSGELETARSVRWQRPPAAARRRARRMPSSAALPAPTPRSTRKRSMQPADIRSLATAWSTPQVENHSFEEAEITLRVSSDGQEGLLGVDGRIWLEGSSTGSADAGPVDVALVQGEHVLAHARVDDGGMFNFVEALSGAWTLEFHLTGGRCLVIEGESR